MNRSNQLKKKQELKFYKSLNKTLLIFTYFFDKANSGEDWLSLMVVVRVVVSVTEVLRCLRFRDDCGSVCSAVVAGVVSVAV